MRASLSCADWLLRTDFSSSSANATQAEKQKKSPEDHPGRDVPGASREDRLRELQPLPRDRAAAAGQLDTPDGGPGSKPGETVIVAPLPRSATSASATLLAGADGWSWWRGRGLTGGNKQSPGSESMAVKTVDRGVESREAGSLRPECGRAGEPRSRRPGSGRTAGKGARSAKSRLVRLRGPAENQKVCFISGAQRAQSFRVKNTELREKIF